MYQNCGKKCGSASLHTETKGSNTGLYCDDCGAWVKWLGKDELRAFEHSMRSATKQEQESVRKYVDSISKPTGYNFWEDNTIHDLRKNPYDLPQINIEEDDDKLLFVEDDSCESGYGYEIGYYRGIENNNNETMWDNCDHGWIQHRVIAWCNLPKIK